MENRRYKQRKLTPEQRLFTRTVLLAFLTGFAFGLMIWFGGTEAYNSIRSGFSVLTPPSFVWPLNALQLIVSGCFLVLFPTTIGLCLQFLKVPQRDNNHSVFSRFGKHFPKIVGLFSIGIGLGGLLDKPLTLTLTDLKASSLEILVSEIALAFLCVLVVPISLSWYLLRNEPTTSRSSEAKQHTR